MGWRLGSIPGTACILGLIYGRRGAIYDITVTAHIRVFLALANYVGISLTTYRQRPTPGAFVMKHSDGCVGAVMWGGNRG